MLPFGIPKKAGPEVSDVWLCLVWPYQRQPSYVSYLSFVDNTLPLIMEGVKRFYWTRVLSLVKKN